MNPSTSLHSISGFLIDEVDLLTDIKHDHPDVEVVIVTGYGSLRSAMEGIRQGAAGYLLKPFNVTELITLTQQTMDKETAARLSSPTTALRSPEIWELSELSGQVWDSIRIRILLTPSVGWTSTVFQEEELSLIPLLSDILEATDRHLLNHSKARSVSTPR
ncbi:MAG: response regulator [Nitrospira sp.]|nr:response regulator [Nitrospira sp.]